jgi:o-succinylbenzoate synthase
VTSGRDPGDGPAERLAELAGLPGIDAVVPFSVRLTMRFRGIEERHGLLLHGAHGWGEWSPFDEYDDAVAAVWLRAALDSAREEPPTPRRRVVPVNVTVPAVRPSVARRMVAAAGCTTAKVKVAEPGQSLDEDVRRVAAVREALGPSGRIRVDANTSWTVQQAITALGRLEEAAGGLEYAEQPCSRLEELAEVRARSGVKIAADEAIRRDRADASLIRDAVDVAVVKVQPSGGIAQALALVSALGLPVVVSSALDTSIGLAAGVRLASALDELPFACGLATGLLLADDVVSSPLVPDAGGIGLATIDALTLRGHVPSPTPERAAWLMARLARMGAAGGST